MSIDILINPEHYFKEEIEKALKNQSVEMPAEVSFYLVNMLSHFMQTENLFNTQSENGLDHEPLALKFNRALGADITEKTRLLKETGDFSLYVSGFFGESLNRSTIDIKYYIGMGEAAYGNLSHVASKKPSQEIFQELSHKFVDCVDILAEVSQQTAICNNESLLNMYQKWLQTKSTRLFKKLQEENIIPIDIEDTDQ